MGTWLGEWVVRSGGEKGKEWVRGSRGWVDLLMGRRGRNGYVVVEVG